MNKAIKGKKVMLFLTGSSVGDGTLALSTGFSLSYNVPMVNPETKDDGDYQTPDEEGDTWEITHNSQETIDLDSVDKLLDDYNEIKKFSIKIAECSNWSPEGLDGATGGKWTPDDTKANITGDVVISSLNLGGTKGSKATLGVTMTGRSELVCNE